MVRENSFNADILYILYVSLQEIESRTLFCIVEADIDVEVSRYSLWRLNNALRKEIPIDALVVDADDGNEVEVSSEAVAGVGRMH